MTLIERKRTVGVEFYAVVIFYNAANRLVETTGPLGKEIFLPLAKNNLKK